MTVRRAIIVTFATTLLFIFIFTILAERLPNFMDFNIESKDLTLQMCMPIDSDMTAYDPARILYADQYGMLREIYSSLVERSKDWDIVAGVADRFEWMDGSVRLHIREGLTASDGIPITAEDAAFSLKRLLVLATNTHGNLSDMLCDGKAPSSIEETCKGISVEGNTLVLTPSTRRPFLLPILTSIDFAVIPKRAVNLTTLKIKDYSITSGPYYHAGINEHGQNVLLPNKSHWHYRPNMPQKVTLVLNGEKIPGGPPQPFAHFAKNNVDHIPCFCHQKGHEFRSFHELRDDTTLKTTVDIARTVLVYTEKGRRDISPHQRRSLGKAVRSLYGKFLSQRHGDEKIVTQFMSALGEGGLTESQKEGLAALYRKTGEFKSEIKLKLSVHPGHKEEVKKILQPLPYIVVHADLSRYRENRDNGLAIEDMPDMYIVRTDSSFNESITMLSYGLSTGLFHLDQERGREWLERYMNIESRNERLTLLKQFHFDFLASPSMVPLTAEPYHTITRQPWKSTSSQFFPLVSAWELEHP